MGKLTISIAFSIAFCMFTRGYQHLSPIKHGNEQVPYGIHQQSVWTIFPFFIPSNPWVKKPSWVPCWSTRHGQPEAGKSWLGFGWALAKRGPNGSAVDESISELHWQETPNSVGRKSMYQMYQIQATAATAAMEQWQKKTHCLGNFCTRC